MHMNELTEFLSSRGFHRIPLVRSAVGHFHTRGTLNGRSVEVLVDTGASCTCVAIALLKELGIAHERIEGDGGGAGGSLEQFRVDGADLHLGDFKPGLTSMAGLDFECVNAPLRAHGSVEVDVIVGGDVFEAHSAVIDYATQTLFLRRV